MSKDIKAFTEKDQFSHSKFNFPASFLVIGTPKSGKSYFIFNLLKDIKDKFDRIVVMLGTKDGADGFLSLINEKKKTPQINILFKYDSEDMMKYLNKLEDEQIAAIKAKKSTKRVLFVFDDILGLGNNFMSHTRSKPSAMAMLASNYRHIGASFMLINQTYMDCIKNIRLTCKYIIITSVGMKDLKTISEEAETLFFSSKDIITIFKRIRENGIGNMLLINNDEDDRHRFWWIHKNGEITNIEPLEEK